MTGTKKDPFGAPLPPVEVSTEEDNEDQPMEDRGESIRSANKLGWVHGADNVYSYAKVKRRSSMDWFLHEATGDMSLACARFDYTTGARGDALLITPPDWTKAERYQALLETELEGEQLRTVQALYQLYSNFTLWHTRSLYTKSVINGYSIRDQEVVYPDNDYEDFQKQSGALDEIEEYASLYAEQIPCYDPSLSAKKKNKWKKGTISEKQVPLFQALYPELNPTEYSGGEAAQLITWKLSSDVVKTPMKNAEESLNSAIIQTS